MQAWKQQQRGELAAGTSAYPTGNSSEELGAAERHFQSDEGEGESRNRETPRETPLVETGRAGRRVEEEEEEEEVVVVVVEGNNIGNNSSSRPDTRPPSSARIGRKRRLGVW